MIRYHSQSKSLLVTASETGTIERISISDPFNLKKIAPFDLSGGNVTAVAVHKDLIAASIKEKKADAPGNVQIFNNNGEKLAEYKTGALPDNIAFSPDGRYLLTANEGEPSDDYKIDPEGSFTLIDLSSGVQNANVKQITLNNIKMPAGARIIKPGSSFAEDAEPEYITFAPDGKEAYATLQENNAIATIDLSLIHI